MSVNSGRKKLAYRMSGAFSLCCLLLSLSACDLGSNDGGGGSSAIQRVASVPYAPAPDTDDFYAQPSPVPNVAPGTIIKSRPISFSPAGLPLPNKAWHIQYMTRDSQDRPIAAVAAVVMPTIPAMGGTRLVSFHFAYDSLGASCVPSKSVAGSTDNGNNTNATPDYLPGLTALGWTLVFPDYEGPYHAYAAGKLSGQVALDGVRAALSFEPLGLEPNTPVGMWGYSGGAIASAWAATLQPHYAPELNVVGIASGGTPADLFGVARSAEDRFTFGLIFSALVGINRAYPALLGGNILNEEGKRIANALKDGCTGGTTDGSEGASGRMSEFTTAEDFFTEPSSLAIEKQISLPQKGMSPRVDMFVFHEVLDEVIPIEGADALVEAWCNDGSPVNYWRSTTGEHVTGGVTSAPLVTAYLNSRLNGSGAPLVPPGSQRCN